MPDFRQIVEQSPPGTLFTREGLLAVIDKAPAPDGPENVSTVQASRLLGRSPKWWRIRCTEGVIEGAYQDEGRWHFPLRAARAYLARRSNASTPTKRRGRRGPNKAPTTQAARAGSAHRNAGTVDDGGYATVGRIALHRAP
jgi:hypothetical protein